MQQVQQEVGDILAHGIEEASGFMRKTGWKCSALCWVNALLVIWQFIHVYFYH